MDRKVYIDSKLFDVYLEESLAVPVSPSIFLYEIDDLCAAYGPFFVSRHETMADKISQERREVKKKAITKFLFSKRSAQVPSADSNGPCLETKIFY